MKNFLKKNRVITLLALIVLLGAFLRLYQFEDMLRFNADQARDARVVDGMFEQKQFPLLGPKAGGTNFKLGPGYYYLEYFSAAVFGRDPAGQALLTVILGIFSIPLLYIFLKYYFSANISLVLVFLYAVSFYSIKYARFAWNPNFIPFFMLAFLIILLKITSGKKPLFWNILGGIIMGIGVQFHTLLIFLMPALFLSAHVYLFAKERKKFLTGLFLGITIVLVLNLPLLMHDLQSGGENWQALLAGIDKKTMEKSGLTQASLKAIQFFLQGNWYVLSGYEPKNWLNAQKLLSLRDFSEIAAAFTAGLFFLCGLVITVRNFIKEKDRERKVFFGLIVLVIIFSLFLFLPLSNELNIRFFITLIFLPFVFLGALMEYANKKLKKEIFYPAFALIITLLCFYNLNVWRSTYDPQNFSGKSDTYGGISLKETREIAKFTQEISQNEEYGDSRFFFQLFEFSRSVEYFNDKAGLKFSGYSEEKTRPGDIVFVVVKNKNAAKTIDDREYLFYPTDSREIGRFTALAFRMK